MSGTAATRPLQLLDPLDEVRGSRVVVCNWRDSAHDQAGGAELYCHEVAEGLARAGCEVTLLAAAVPGRPVVEEVGGVRVVRRGSPSTVYAHAALHLLRHRRRVDVVVDVQNGIPFFAPLLVGRGTAVVGVVHHVHQDQFALHFGPLVARLGRWLEGPFARLVYRRTPVVVVSPSTREDVRRRLRFVSELHVVPNGVVPPVPTVPPAPTGAGPGTGGAGPDEDDDPRLVVVTRLVPQKRVEQVVEAMPDLLRRFPNLHLDVVGRGPSAAAVADAVRREGVGAHVTLHGYVDDATRDALLSRAWLTVTASVAEGWGLTVVEANAAGVPCVAHDVPGLRDAVVDGRTGWLVRPGRRLADVVGDALEELHDPDRRSVLREACRQWADGFRWEDSTRRLAAVMVSERRRRGLRGERRSRSDLAAVAQVPAAATRAWRLREGAGVRATDVVVTTEDGSLDVLFVGTDEEGARRALARNGLAGSASTRLALGADHLVPAAAGPAAPVPPRRPGAP